MYRMLDALIARIVTIFGIPETGKYSDWWSDIIIASYDRRRYREAQPRAHNPVLVQHWVDADTPHADILAWFDRQLAVAPLRPQLNLIDQQGVFLLDAPAFDHQERSASFSFAADDAPVLAMWQGSQGQWIRNGRDAIRAAIPIHHLGLALVVNAAPPIVVLRHEEYVFTVQ